MMALGVLSAMLDRRVQWTGRDRKEWPDWDVTNTLVGRSLFLGLGLLTMFTLGSNLRKVSNREVRPVDLT